MIVQGLFDACKGGLVSGIYFPRSYNYTDRDTNSLFFKFNKIETLLYSMIRPLQKSILLIISFIPAVVFSQIKAPEACDTVRTAYTATSSQDTVFFFSGIPDSTFIIPDTANFKGYSIKWEEFEPGTGFINPVGNLKKYFTPDTIARGFRLNLTTSTDTVKRICWVLTNKFDTEILTKDNDGNLSSGAYTAICDTYGPIQVHIDQSDLIYYDPVTLDTLLFEPKYTKEWIKEEDVPEGKMSEQGTIFGNIRYILNDAYWKDMYYTFVLTDGCGNEAKDSVYVRSIRPKASFEFQHINLDDHEYYPDRDTAYYFFYAEATYGENISAPAKYLFINKSENAHEYLWSFGDSTSLKTTKDSVLKEYFLWGNYNVKLTAQHNVKWWNQTCTSDTTIISDDKTGIHLSQPTLQTPNVFCVNSSSYLGTWRFEDVTIAEFEIAIYSRTGRRVHHFKGNIRDWNGWDGSIRNSDNKVSTGVYYYVVKAFHDIRNIDKNIKNKDIWIGGQDGGDDGGGGGTPDNTTIKPNSEYRGFIHVFNN
jgi:hypothetical protein